MKRKLSMLIGLVLWLTGTSFLAPVVASATIPSTPEDIVATALDSAAMQQAVDEVPLHVIHRNLRQLKRADAFIDLLELTDRSGRYMKYFAAVLTQSQIEDLITGVQDRHYELAMDEDGLAKLSLVEGKSPPVVDPHAWSPGASDSGVITTKEATYGYACWQAYVAAFAFALGTGMVCVPFGLWALACAGGSALLFPINWNSACK